MMEGSPVVEGDPSGVLPLQCYVTEKDSSNLGWQNLDDKISTLDDSKLLYLAVQYVQEISNNEVEFNNFSPAISENEGITPYDAHLISEEYAPEYDTLLVATDGQSQFQDSVVVPASRNDSQQISIVVDPTQAAEELILENPTNFEWQEGNYNLNPTDSQFIVNSEPGLVTEINCHENSGIFGQELIIPTSGVILPPDNCDNTEQNSAFLNTDNTFFQDDGNKNESQVDFVSSCNNAIQSEFSSSCQDGVFLNGAVVTGNEGLLHTTKFPSNEKNMNPEELLLSDPGQNNFLLKSSELMEVDSYNLPHSSYITSEDGSSYPTMEEQLNINVIEKPENEYLLQDVQDVITFGGNESTILQPNLEVLTSEALDGNQFLYDKTRLRQHKKTPAENIGFDNWCEDCELGIKCKRHDTNDTTTTRHDTNDTTTTRHELKVISDKPILSRARATLPKELLEINVVCGSNEEGVFARKTIMKQARFGPVEGRLLKEWDDQDEINSDAVRLLLEVETGELLKLDVSDEDTSNWMRFVRKAKTLKEQNLMLTQQGESLYFITSQTIQCGHELMVGYSRQYAQKRDLTILEDLCWNCFECSARFPSSKILQRHLGTHELDKDFRRKSRRRRRWKGKSEIPDKNDKNTEEDFECPSCNKYFLVKGTFIRHVKQYHWKKKLGKPTKDVKAMWNTLFKKKGDESEWLCTHCNLAFDNPSLLNLHNLTHADEDLAHEPVPGITGLTSDLTSVYHEGDIQCPQCAEAFSSKRQLIAHASSHGKYNHGKYKRPVKPFKCDRCEKSFSTNLWLKRHKTAHGFEEGKPYACNVCYERFPNSSALTDHLKIHPVSESSDWFCEHCNLTFKSETLLNLHTLVHAAKNSEPEVVFGVPSEMGYEEDEYLLENGDIRCPECTQDFSTKKELIEHVSSHGKVNINKIDRDPLKPFKCHLCYKCFSSDGFQAHMILHRSEEAKPYQCKLCSRRFPSNTALCSHLRNHDANKTFDCRLCNQKFSQFVRLKEHVITHSSNGRFTCPHCNKVIKDYSGIRRHIRMVHSGNEYECIECGSVFATIERLRMHSTTHSNHCEFLCSECGKQFRRKDKMKEHMLRMHSIDLKTRKNNSATKMSNSKITRITPKMPPVACERFVYKCRHCLESFKRRGMLVNHLASQHPNVAPDSVPELTLPIIKTKVEYFCQYCDKVYATNAKRKAHILKNHPGSALPLSCKDKRIVSQVPGIPNPSCPQLVESVKTNSFGCTWCHKQYVSKPKLIEHQRENHPTRLPSLTEILQTCKKGNSPKGKGRVNHIFTSKGEENKKENKDLVGTEKPKNNNTTYVAQEVFNVSGELDLDLPFKKPNKGHQENISSELFQVMTDLSQSLVDYSLPFPGTQENFTKVMEMKEGGDGISRNDSIPSAQMTLSWPDLPPYPPR